MFPPKKFFYRRGMTRNSPDYPLFPHEYLRITFSFGRYSFGSYMVLAAY